MSQRTEGLLDVNTLRPSARPATLGGSASLLYGGALNLVLIAFSAVSFFGYGVSCFLSRHLRKEFERYGMPAQRMLVGGLQICASIGLVAGLSYPWMGRAAAAGLALMMLVAVAVRIRIKDTLLQTTPAVLYLLLNAYLCLAAF